MYIYYFIFIFKFKFFLKNWQYISSNDNFSTTVLLVLNCTIHSETMQRLSLCLSSSLSPVSCLQYKCLSSSLFLCLSVFLYLCLLVRLFLCLSVCLSLCLSLSPVFLSHCLSLSFCLSDSFGSLSVVVVVVIAQCDQKKLPNAYKSCPKIISIEE